MIEEIVIGDAATFKNEIINPKKINYFYGFNGSGKSTIGKIIENPSIFKNCSRKFRDDEIEVLIYNQDFVDNNFYETSNIKGIFTLGKDASDAQKIIEQTKIELDKKVKESNSLKAKIDEKNNEKNTEEKNFQEKCWEIKLKYSEKFKEALTGKIGNKSLFAENCLSVEINKENLFTIQDLELKYNDLYKKELKAKALLQTIDFKQFKDLESSSILSESIKGNDSLSVSELIEKLNNSDWVKNGLKYLEINNSQCPFCQQDLNHTNIQELAKYFDKEYEDNCNLINNIYKKYGEEFQIIYQTIENNINQMNDSAKTNLESKLKEFNLIFESNKTYLLNKIEKPSELITLTSTETILEEIKNIIDLENEVITEFNKMVENSEKEKNELKKNLWNFFASELESHIKIYNKSISDIEKTILIINEKISNIQLEISNRSSLIRQKESEITGITQTIIEINKILTSFGFNSFKLKESENKGKYKIVRNDGSNVGRTLSEGEYRFISFLYFYQLIKGSTEHHGIVKDRIIVIDDPISSLDSNTVFIVSTLVKNIINNCLNNNDGIKQVFVLTHNVYFYKEIVYKGSGKHKKETQEQYYVVKKIDNVSSIQDYAENPIETTYQLLWNELHEDSKKNRATVYNTMRRILEYYFNIVGKQDYEKCVDNFEGEEKILCKSLISFINDNSHYISDDFSMIFEDDTIEKYQKVFRKIFENLGHISHYNMMMGIEDDNKPDDDSGFDINEAIKEEMRDDSLIVATN